MISYAMPMPQIAYENAQIAYENFPLRMKTCVFIRNRKLRKAFSYAALRLFSYAIRFFHTQWGAAPTPHISKDIWGVQHGAAYENGDDDKPLWRKFPIPDWFVPRTAEQTIEYVKRRYRAGLYKQPEPWTDEEYEAWLNETPKQRAARLVQEIGERVEREHYRRSR